MSTFVKRDNTSKVEGRGTRSTVPTLKRLRNARPPPCKILNPKQCNAECVQARPSSSDNVDGRVGHLPIAAILICLPVRKARKFTSAGTSAWPCYAMQGPSGHVCRLLFPSLPNMSFPIPMLPTSNSSAKLMGRFWPAPFPRLPR